MGERSTRAIDTPTQTGNIWPPPLSANETDAERARRVQKELKARQVSEAIDHAIDLERIEKRARKAATKILLLGERIHLVETMHRDNLVYIGQAESGKSTILKNFQLLFAPKSFHAECRGVWKAVIHLNLVRSVNFVLDLLEDSKASRRPLLPAEPQSSNGKYTTSNDLRFLKLRLAPLRQVEQILTRRFCPPDFEADASGQYQKDRASEVSVRGLSGWKTLLRNRRNPQNPAASDDLDDSQRVIEACKDDMTSLWEDSVVQTALKKHKVRLQDQSGLSALLIHLSML
jgi:guanine nucleotide-binding protein subunit alpha